MDSKLALRTALNGRPRAWDWDENAVEEGEVNSDALQTALNGRPGAIQIVGGCWWALNG